MIRAIVCPKREDRRGRLPAQLDPVRFRRAGRNPVQVGREQRVEPSPLRRKQRHQRVVRGFRDGGRHRRAGWRRVETRVALIATDDRVHRIEDRDVNNRERQSRASGAKLLAKDAGLTGCRRCVIDRVGIRRHFIPAKDRVRGLVSARREC